MAKLTLFIVLALLWFGTTFSLPTPDEERYLDREYTRELIAWLSAIAPASSTNPCRYCSNGNYFAPMQKKNSELINSLLSLPKNMNDAGK